MSSVILFFKHPSFHKAANLIVALVIALGLVGVAFQPASAAVAPGITCTQYYTVVKGDTLAKIGAKFGVSWRDLAFINMIPNPNRIYTGQRLCVQWKKGTQPAPSTIPTFSIVSVVADKTVTIRTNNFPANDSFNVLMGAFGTRGVGGIKVTSINSGSGGSFTATFNIPSSLAGSYRIAIRLQSPSSGYFAYNWFFNNTTGTGTGGGDDGTPGYTGFPTFRISAVTRDATVTIRTTNFPANDTFDVLMGAMGTRGVGGIKVTSIGSGSGGSFTATFNIPSALAGSSRIAIRLQSPTSGYFAYNWFYNNTTP